MSWIFLLTYKEKTIPKWLIDEFKTEMKDEEPVDTKVEDYKR